MAGPISDSDNQSRPGRRIGDREDLRRSGLKHVRLVLGFRLAF